MLNISGTPPQPNKNRNVSFGNNTFVNVFGNKTLTNALVYLDNNPAIELGVMDFVTMIGPRTVTDLVQQNPDYAIETFCREAVPDLLNPYGPGLISGVMLAAKGWHGVTAGKDTVNEFQQVWRDVGGKNFHTDEAGKSAIVKNYAKKILGNTEGLVGNNKFAKLAEAQLDELSDGVTRVILDKSLGKKGVNRAVSELAGKFTDMTGAESSLKVRLGQSLSTGAGNLFNDMVHLPRRIFIDHAGKHGLDRAVSDVTNFVKKRTVMGIGITLAGISSLSFINKAFTKWRTGSNVYCAYKDFREIKEQPPSEKEKQEKKQRLWGAKALGIAGIGLITATTMGGFAKGGFLRGGGIKNFVDKITLKEKHAGMDLLKLIYGTSIAGRFLSSRDEQEVKVTAVRDYAGFMNWLVLGGFVSRGVAHLMDKSLVNINGQIRAKNPLKTATNWLSKVSLKTHGELKAVTKHLPKPEQLARIAKLNAARMAGIAYSITALGIVMPMINNHMTNKAREKQIKEQERNNAPKVSFAESGKTELLKKFLPKSRPLVNSMFENLHYNKDGRR